VNLTQNTAARSDAAVVTWVKDHPVIALVLLIVLLAWPNLIAGATDSHGLTQFHFSPWLDLVTGWSPAIAAFTITAIVQGRAGVRELARKTLRWRVGACWYVTVIVVSALIILAEGGFYALLTGEKTALPLARFSPLQAISAFASTLVLYMVANTEEIAWRGFALPRLQKRYGALAASLVLWVPWTLFHLPYFFTQGSMLQQMGFPIFASGTLMLSVLFTWLFNNTRGSVFICTFLHALLNTWPLLLIVEDSAMPGYVQFVTDSAIVLFLVLLYGAARLSYKRDNEPFTY
jgi:membrane protease YdiL (CAAX protease family)